MDIDKSYIAFQVKLAVALGQRNWKEVAALHKSYGGYLELMGAKGQPKVKESNLVMISVPHRPLIQMGV